MFRPFYIDFLESSMEIVDTLLVVKENERIVSDEWILSARAKNLSSLIAKGQYLQVIGSFDETPVNSAGLLKCCEGGNTFCDVRELVVKHIDSDSEDCPRAHKFELLLLGIAYLELYCQVNYTGPELPPAVLAAFTGADQAAALRELECDGSYAFRIIEVPQALLLARIILTTLVDPAEAGWREGIVLDSNGKISRKRMESDGQKGAAVTNDATGLRSLTWWCARAAVIHLRLLQKQGHEDVPTLWQEAQERFQVVLRTFASLSKDTKLTTTAPLANVDADQVRQWASGCTLPVPEGASEALTADWSRLQRQLAAQAWLEWGLCCLHFGFGDKGKRSFAVAKEVAGLKVDVSGSMGKRTKYQQSDVAQLYLYAKSSLLPGSEPEAVLPPPPPPSAEVTVKKSPALGAPAIPKLKREASTGGPVPALVPSMGAAEGEHLDGGNGQSWEHSEWELGRRMVREAENGEEVAVREVLLDSMDGGAAENIILEGGPRFAEKTDKGGALHPVDQAIVLALCLDVGNSNPVDGLTNEEMQPYVERVLDSATNWMIHSTALLERSWLEFERRRTADRAMLQIQALIDQHTTKLTMLQSTRQAIEESAPVEDRIRYLYSIVYPAQYELKRDLAQRYLRCQVFMSALNYFRELEMWDEVVTCYQLMDKPHKAELVVREQLQKEGETPYMLTSLADLTRKEEYYERAWEVSKGRYPRAKRTLGKICFDRGDFARSVEHLDQALAVHPLVATAWYLRGIACMRLERWEDAIQSFVRCVQQDMEIGEAWANIGAVNMHLRNWAKANEALTEALRHKHDNWRILENLMSVTLAMGKHREVIRYMQRLLDLRHKSERPVHKDELRRVCYIVASHAQREARARARGSTVSTPSSAVTSPSSGVETPAEPAVDLFATNMISAEVAAERAAAAEPSPALAGALASLRELLEEEPDFDADDMDSLIEIDPLTDLPAQANKLLTNIAVAVPSDAEIWDIYADFQHILGRFRLELDCRTKQFRKLTSEDAWEKSADKIAAIAQAAKYLARAHHFKGVTKTDFYTCKMILQTALRRMQSGPLECLQEKHLLERLIAKFASMCDSL